MAARTKRAVIVGAALLLGVIARAQNLFEANSTTGIIYQFTPTGGKSTFVSGVNFPFSLAFNSAGILFEGDYASGTIYKYTANGTQSTFATGLNKPTGLAFNSAGILFEADYGSGTIYEFTTGGVRSTFASGLSFPTALAFDGAGDLFAGSYTTGVIYEFPAAGGQTNFATGLFNPLALAFDIAGNLYEGDSGTGTVNKFTPAGTQSTFASGFNNPSSLAIDKFGNVFVGDSGLGNIYQITPGGTKSIFATNLDVVGLAFPLSAPTITRQPLSQTVLAGSQVMFAAAAIGTAPLYFQWRFNGTNLSDGGRITGSRTGTLTISNVRTNDAGPYSVVVTNASGSAQSMAAMLNVLAAPAAVFGWGYDFDGEIVPPTALPGFVAIASRNTSSVGLQTNGTVVNWGFDGVISPPVGLSNVVAIAAGGDSSYLGDSDFSLALTSTGSVAAWGDDSYGQLDGALGLSNVVAIAAGGYHSVAIQSNGTVVAWGDDSQGETNVPPGLSNVIAVAAGNYYNLALKSNGVVVAWGGNNNFGATNVPPGLSNVVAIAAGAYHSLALKNDGTVVAWGYNSSGQTNVPPGLSNVRAIAAGSYHSLALRSNGTVVEWGDDSYGETNFPPGLSNVVVIAAGNDFSQALTYTPATRPPNDNFANAIVLAGPSVTTSGSNVNATWEPGETGTGGYGPASVWWTWTADENGRATVSTVGSSFPLQLFVYTGNNLSSLNQVDTSSSSVIFTVTPGAQFYIEVDGQNNGGGPAEGNIALSVSECPAPTINISYAGQTTGTDGIHVHFTADIFSSGTGLSCDHWQVLSPLNYITTINEGCNNFEVVVSPTNEEQVVVTNFISDSCGLGGGGGGSGDTCGICLSRGTPSLLTGTTGGSATGQTNSTCCCGNVSTNAQWYRLIATNGTGLITVSTQGSSNATMVAVFTGALNSLSSVACNNGLTDSNKISLVTFLATEGTVYWIAVDPRTNNAASHLRVASGFQPTVASYGMSNGVFTLQSSTALPITYQLLATTNLAASLSNWPVALSTNLSTNYPYLYFQETNMKAYPRRFYLLKPLQ